MQTTFVCKCRQRCAVYRQSLSTIADKLLQTNFVKTSPPPKKKCRQTLSKMQTNAQKNLGGLQTNPVDKLCLPSIWGRLQIGSGLSAEFVCRVCLQSLSTRNADKVCLLGMQTKFAYSVLLISSVLFIRTLRFASLASPSSLHFASCLAFEFTFSSSLGSFPQT